MAKIEIDVPDNLYNEIIRISNELKTQSCRGTADPCFYQVLTYKEYPTSEEYSSLSAYINEDGNKIEGFNFENKDDFKKYLEEQGYNEDDITDYLDDYDKNDYKLSDWLDEEFNIRYISFLREEHLENCFLTESAIKSHILSNKHNYPDEVYDYLNYAYRNPELLSVITFLKLITK